MLLAAEAVVAAAPGWAYPLGGPAAATGHMAHHQSIFTGLAVFSPPPQPAMLIPAAVLLLAGAWTLAASQLTRRAGSATSPAA